MNRTAVITGASSGIGKALALEFAKRGYNLGLAARRIDRLEALRAEIASMPGGQNLQVEITALDVSNTATVGPVLEGLFGALGQVDVVVVNAGVSGDTTAAAGVRKRLRGSLRKLPICAGSVIISEDQWFSCACRDYRLTTPDTTSGSSRDSTSPISLRTAP